MTVDEQMIINTLHTDVKEAIDLMSFSFFVHIFCHFFLQQRPCFERSRKNQEAFDAFKKINTNFNNALMIISFYF